MRHFLQAAFVSGLVCSVALVTKVNGKVLNLESLSIKVQESLNNKNNSYLKFLHSRKEALNLEHRKTRFLNHFPNAKWTIKPLERLKDGRSMIEVSISGEKQSEIHKYSLEAKQKLAISHINNEIISQEIVSEYSIMRSNKNVLPITLNIPDVVLTGTRYHVDVIFEEPLGDAIIAGGLITLTNEHANNQSSPPIDLFPLRAGGLFKSVQAPFEPGRQGLAAMLVHPEGLISITKVVKVVSNQSQITP